MIPREHGAWSMLLTPFVAAAVLAKRWSWVEIAALAAVVAAFLAKEPMIVLARQRFVWKLRRPESDVAWRWLAGEAAVLAVSGAVFLRVWPPAALGLLAGSACAFSALAVTLTVRNRQRAAWLQIVSAAALTSSSLAACLSALGKLPAWSWLLWASCAAQAAAGILVVHARLDARRAARDSRAAPAGSRRAAAGVVAMLPVVALVLALTGRATAAGAFLLPFAAYCFELRRQRDPESLRMPLRTAGLQAMTLSITFTALIVTGLWAG